MFVDLGCFSLILFSGKKFGINRFRWGDILYIMFAYLSIISYHWIIKKHFFSSLQKSMFIEQKNT